MLINKLKLFDIDILHSRPFEGIVIHHSATVDNITHDWDIIKNYHTSYRVDYNTIANPLTQQIPGETTFFDYQTGYNKITRRYYKIKDIETYNRSNSKIKEKPWNDIGYNFGIERVNWNLILHFGRSLYLAGAHSGIKGNNIFNEKYIGICVIGNFDINPPDESIYLFVTEICKILKQSYNINNNNILGHREIFAKVGSPQYKTCPGKQFDMDKVRYMTK